jgi:hypothetical protein
MQKLSALSGECGLIALIDDGELEGKMIDYKRDRVGQADGDKKEFLYDVSSFANAAARAAIRRPRRRAAR